MGVTIHIDPIVLRLGSLQVGWHGLFTALALMAGLWLARRLAHAWDVPEAGLSVVTLWAIPGGIIGARLLHVIDAWEGYVAQPVRILRINEGGIAIYGAILGGSMAAALAARIYGVPLGKLADAGGLGLLLGQAIGRIGDLINGEHWALTTTLPWAVRYTHPNTVGQPEFVHPVVGYELVWDLVVIGGLLRWGGRLPVPGMRYWVYLGLYGIGRFFLSFLRLDRTWFWELRQAQFVALLTVVTAGMMLVILPRSRATVANPGPSRRGRTVPRSVGVMGMRRRSRTRQHSGSAEGLEWLTGIGTGFLAYFIAEVVLVAQPHPLHWVAAGTLGLFGYGSGRLWVARHDRGW